MQDLRERFDGELRQAYRRGAEEYGELPVDFETYAGQLLAILTRRLGGDDDQLGAALRSTHTTDLYLAIACDCKAEGAWEVLARRFYPGLRAMALRAGADEAEADELARELPGSLIAPPPTGSGATRISSYDGRGSLFAWLASIANRKHLDRLRERRDRQPPPPPSLPTPSEVVVGAETGTRVEEALREALLDLTMRETLLLVWKYRDNLPQAEMAQRLEVSEPRVSQLMRRTVTKVRDAVLARIQDESAPQWASRDQLWSALRNVVGKLLDHQ